MTPRYLFLLGLLNVLLTGGGAYGQTSDGLPPYEADLVRLVSLLGTLEYLQPLCRQEDLGIWQAQMANLLEAENPTPPRRQKLTARYNEAYRALEQIHHNCTPAADLIRARSVEEAVALTAKLAEEFRPLQQAEQPASATEEPGDDPITTQ